MRCAFKESGYLAYRNASGSPHPAFVPLYARLTLLVLRWCNFPRRAGDPVSLLEAFARKSLAVKWPFCAPR